MSAERMAPEDVEALTRAKRALESPGLAMQIAGAIGAPIERGIDRLPSNWQARIVGLSQSALEKAADVAIWSLDARAPASSRDFAHKIAVSVSGAAGGAFGLPALAVELPVSTTIMLRSVADIARSEGEKLDATNTKLACLEVFALGGRSASDDATDSAYYVARASLAKAVSAAEEYLAAQPGARVTAPPVIQLVQKIAARFGLQVSEKAAAQALPVVGAAGGVLVNNLFIAHFQTMARGHFTVRRLERRYSPALVEAAYREL